MKPKVFVGTSIGQGKEYTLPFLLPVLRGMEGVGDVHIVFDDFAPPAEFLEQLQEGETYEVLPKLKGDFGHGSRCGRVREETRKKFLKTDFTHLYFHDADILPPKDIIPRLLAHELPVVTGMYCMRGTSAVSFPGSVIADGLATPFLSEGLKEGSLVPCIHWGMGCMLLQRGFLTDVPFREPKWLDKALISEDVAWGRDFAALMGMPSVFLDMSLSCWHVASETFANRVHIGQWKRGAVWTGTPYFISNLFGNWEQGIPQTHLAKEYLSQLSHEFRLGEFPELSLEIQPLAAILEGVL